MNLKHLKHLPLAADLIRGMLAPAHGARPSMPAVMCHPLWWDVHRRLAFLIDVSDRVETEDRAVSGAQWLGGWVAGGGW